MNLFLAIYFDNIIDTFSFLASRIIRWLVDEFCNEIKTFGFVSIASTSAYFLLPRAVATLIYYHSPGDTRGRRRRHNEEHFFLEIKNRARNKHLTVVSDFIGQQIRLRHQVTTKVSFEHNNDSPT